MRIRTLAPFALAITIACGGAETEEAAMTEDMTEAMDDAPAMPDADAAMATITDYWQTHYNMGHGSMVASKFVEDGVLWGSSGAMLYGREAIGEGLQSRMDAGSSEVAIHPGAAMVFGDQIVARGHYVLTGGDARNSGYYMAVAENVDGEWALKGMVANLDTPDQTLSAGAMMVAVLAASPEAEGLFHRGIAQSAGWMGLTMTPMRTRAQTGQQGTRNGSPVVSPRSSRPLAVAQRSTTAGCQR